jgi:hypothetical protein
LRGNIGDLDVQFFYRLDGNRRSVLSNRICGLYAVVAVAVAAIAMAAVMASIVDVPSLKKKQGASWKKYR